jgi:hypothetical protein
VAYKEGARTTPTNYTGSEATIEISTWEEEEQDEPQAEMEDESRPGPQGGGVVQEGLRHHQGCQEEAPDLRHE